MSIRNAEVVIIGGGVIGLAVARAVAQQGVNDICLIERAGLGTEASHAAAGMLAPQAEADSNDEFFTLACKSRDLYPEFTAALLEETGIDVELDTTGTLYLAFSEHDKLELDSRYDWQSGAGLSVEQLSVVDALKLEPALNMQLIGALRFPGDIQVENRKLLSALANSVAKLQVEIVTGTEVTKVCLKDGRVDGVQTNGDFISCKRVVIAAGCWTNNLKFTEGDRVLAMACQIKPVRGQMVCLEATPRLTRHVVYSTRGYIVPRRDGRLLAGSTSESAGFEKVNTGGGISSILNNAIQIAPTLSQLPVVDSWAGLRPKATDGLPVIGPYGEIDGLLYATGHYRNGILLAPITGQLLAESITGKELTVSVDSFTPDRFLLISAA